MFGKKSNPGDDPHSIGNLLIAGGHCTEQQIAVAKAFQKGNPDVLMGEHLVREGFIDEEILALMIARQDAARGRNAGLVKFARMAVARTKAVAVSLDNLMVTEKLK